MSTRSDAATDAAATSCGEYAGAVNLAVKLPRAETDSVGSTRASGERVLVTRLTVVFRTKGLSASLARVLCDNNQNSVCVCVCVCVSVCAYTCTHTYKQNMHARAHTHTHSHTGTTMHAHTHTHARTHTHTHTHVNMHACIHLHPYMRLGVRTCIDNNHAPSPTTACKRA